MKVLYLTKYSRLGASSRMRSYQYFPYLEKAGMDIDVRPLFDDTYLTELYSKTTSVKTVLLSYLRRLFILATVFRYDLVVIEKEIFPYMPAIFEFVLSKLGVKYVVDYDDAIFHSYDLSKSALVKLFLKNKIKHVMRHSAVVTAGNGYLANYAKAAGARKIEIIPTVVDINRYSVKDTHNDEVVVIGWIGSPTTLKYLKGIAQVLDELCNQYKLKVHIIGGKEGIGLANNEKVIPWSEESEAELIKAFDIGVMPLENSAWENGKCGYKLIQYMACGLPVVASPVGVNVDIVRNGHNGYLASTMKEWKEALTTYIENALIRKQHGNNGRAIVAETYNTDVTAVKIIKILTNTAK